MHQSLWWNRSLAEGTSHRLQLLPFSGIQEGVLFFFFFRYLVTLSPTGIFKPGAITAKEGNSEL